MKKDANKKMYMSLISFMLVLLLTIMPHIAKVSYADSNELFSNFSSSSMVIVHVESGEVLYGKNQHDKRQVASITKLMTTLLTLEKINDGSLSLEDDVVASSHAASMEGSQAFLDAGSSYKVKDLLKSVIVASANDSAVALAEHIAGTEENFAKMMNAKAQELGMNETLYANATGLSNPNQYSTAYDTTIILKEVSKYDIFNEDSSIWMDEFVHPSGRVTELVNTNRLIRYYDRCKNGKTGYTDEAGFCLATTASHNGLNIMAVNLGAKSSKARFSENQSLLNYGFSNYQSYEVLNENNYIDHNLNIKNAKNNNIKLKPATTYSVLSKIGEENNIDLKYKFNKDLKAPIKAGSTVGICYITNNGVVVGQVDIITCHNIEVQSYKDIVYKLANNWSF